MRQFPDKCPNCQSTELYKNRIASTGMYGPQLLPGLGSFWSNPKFDIVLCANCGRCEFFADEDACEKVNEALTSGWKRVGEAR